MKLAHTSIAAALMVMAGLASAADNIDVSAPALFEGGAMLVINGKRTVLKTGETGPENVKLISANSKQAVVEINGDEVVIKLGKKISGSYGKASKKTIVLSPQHGGHYITEGLINGHSVQFLVDTGATYISMNRPTAESIGLNYLSGTRGRSNTAGGVVNVYQVTLDRVRIGDIETTEVQATVHEGEFPNITLLGNSFLSRMDLIREGAVLKIIER